MVAQNLEVITVMIPRCSIHTSFNSFLISALTECLSEGVEDSTAKTAAKREVENGDLYTLKTKHNNYMKKTAQKYLCGQNSTDLVQ